MSDNSTFQPEKILPLGYYTTSQKMGISGIRNNRNERSICQKLMYDRTSARKMLDDVKDKKMLGLPLLKVLCIQQ